MFQSLVQPVLNGTLLKGDEADPDQEWNVWSDERMVEKRKQERKSTGLNATEKINLAVDDLRIVRSAAAAAKSSGNREKQKLTGLMLRALKQELSEIGRL